MKTTCRVTLWFLLLIAIVLTKYGLNASGADVYQIDDAYADSGLDFAYDKGSVLSKKILNHKTLSGGLNEDSSNGIIVTTQASTEKNYSQQKKPKQDNPFKPEPLRLKLQDFIRLVREKNEQIGFQDSHWMISREAVKGARAIFEPAFVGSYQYQEDNRNNTVQEIIAQSFTAEPELHEKSNNYQAAVEGLLPTGGRLNLGYQLRDFSNNIIKRFDVDNEAVTFFGASLTQPLLKGGGIKPTMAGIRVAETDAGIEFQNYRAVTMRIVSRAIVAYWDLYIANEKLKVRINSVHNAEQLLRNNIVRASTGKMAETEVLEAEAGVSLRKSLQSGARQQIVFAMNNVRTFFSTSVAEKDVAIEPADRIEIKDIKLNFSDSLVKAFKLKAEYLSVHQKIQREEIRLVYAKNQRWPQLDMKASYGLNGLATDPGGSWDEVKSGDYDTWSVGLELRIPLGGDKKSRSELGATRQRKRQALLELKAVEVAMANTVDTAIRSVQNSLDQLKHYSDVVDFNKRLLDAEIARFKAGKSNSRLLLEKEEDLHRAEEARLDSLAKYQNANTELALAEGSLLLKYGIEMMKVEL